MQEFNFQANKRYTKEALKDLKKGGCCSSEIKTNIIKHLNKIWELLNSSQRYEILAIFTDSINGKKTIKDCLTDEMMSFEKLNIKKGGKTSLVIQRKYSKTFITTSSVLLYNYR